MPENTSDLFIASPHPYTIEPALRRSVLNRNTPKQKYYDDDIVLPSSSQGRRRPLTNLFAAFFAPLRSRPTNAIFLGHSAENRAPSHRFFFARRYSIALSTDLPVVMLNPFDFAQGRLFAGAQDDSHQMIGDRAIGICANVGRR